MLQFLAGEIYACYSASSSNKQGIFFSDEGQIDKHPVFYNKETEIAGRTLWSDFERKSNLLLIDAISVDTV